nr:CRISPR-associated protein Cas4 [Dehalococcoides mccartyi]
MYTEDDLLPISGLQHLAFCERQVALIHIEGLWEENVFTAEGQILHEHVHKDGEVARGDLRLTRGLRLRSLNLGLIGIADLVEFHRVKEQKDKPIIEIPGLKGYWQPFIVEYKRGLPKSDRRDKVQLCAQVICLEEMLNIEISQAAFFYGKPRRRAFVDIDSQLREETENIAKRLHELIDIGKTPPAEYSEKCQRCSLVDLCMPKMPHGNSSVEDYLRKSIAENEKI